MQHISLVSSAVQNIVINMTFSASKADTFHYIMNYFFYYEIYKIYKSIEMFRMQGMFDTMCFFLYYPVGENLDLL